MACALDADPHISSVWKLQLVVQIGDQGWIPTPKRWMERALAARPRIGSRSPLTPAAAEATSCETGMSGKSGKW